MTISSIHYTSSSSETASGHESFSTSNAENAYGASRYTGTETSDDVSVRIHRHRHNRTGPIDWLISAIGWLFS